MLTKEQINKFQKIYEQRFGIKLDYAEAETQGTQLLMLMEIICRPLNGHENEKTEGYSA